jgi:hypothetical protein
MKKTLIITSLIMVLVISACGVRQSAAPLEIYEGAGGGAPSSDIAPLATGAPRIYSEEEKAFGDAFANSAALQDRLIIMNADLTIVVPDPQTKMQMISDLANSLGGFVVSMSMYQTTTQNGEVVDEGSISIRVPAEKLGNALDQVKLDAVEVRNENRTGQDVTSTYVDLESQLTNLELAEADLQAIMDEAKNNPNSNTTSKTQDVLAVYTQIVSVRGQIESIKGQMQYYEQASSFSLVNVTLIAEETIQPIEIGGWRPEGVARDAIQALIRFWQGFVNFLITLFLLVLPVLLTILAPIGLLTWAIIAIVRRQKRKKIQTPKA